MENYVKFEEAIDLYKKMDFQKALDIFRKLSLKWDNPSKTYIERCNSYIIKNPWKEWDWIWSMQEK